VDRSPECHLYKQRSKAFERLADFTSQRDPARIVPACRAAAGETRAVFHVPTKTFEIR
jgi:hypothetical protein